GRQFRSSEETVLAISQSYPPVAVKAEAEPLICF
ncbi:MAG: hypothetical protein JWQ61_3751, partial [Collimonas fungivorans]|nr:hypothetical protein [Collimonas fungivorans]